MGSAINNSGISWTSLIISTTIIWTTRWSSTAPLPTTATTCRQANDNNNNNNRFMFVDGMAARDKENTLRQSTNWWTTFEYTRASFQFNNFCAFKINSFAFYLFILQMGEDWPYHSELLIQTMLNIKESGRSSAVIWWWIRQQGENRRVENGLLALKIWKSTNGSTQVSS